VNASPRLELAVPDDQDFATRMGVSVEAVQLLRSSEVIDLHLDCFIPPRLYRYDLFKRHDKALFGGRFFGHLDFHRIVDAGLTGGCWSITTNPFRFAGSRWKVFQKNLTRFRALMDATGGRFSIARNASEYKAVRDAGNHAVMVCIQGGNALEKAPDGPGSIPDDIVTRVTLVHLTNSCYGVTSSPLRLWRNGGLSDKGKTFVKQLNAKRIFVDLAHIHPPSFWDAVEAHDKSQPLVATHTGVAGVRKHWRNLDDKQVKAIADTGGVVGIIFASQFLKVKGGPKDHRMVLDHLEHVINVAGEDVAAIGSDYDGAITPPTDLRTGVEYVRLVQGMLDRNWSEERIRKVLALNYLATFGRLRP